MDFVLIFPLILAFLSTGQCNPEVTDLKCYSKCPIGYHKVDGNCHNSSAPNRCRKCQGDTFTEIENAVEKCRRCKPCGHLQMVIRPCAFNHDTVCDCKDKYFNADRGDTLNCQPCNCKNCPGYDSADYKKKCLPCEWCTPSTTTPTPTPTSTTPSATTSTFTAVTASGATASKMTSNPSMIPLPHPSTNQLTWMILAGVVMIFVMLVWLPLLCSSTYRVFCCPCFSANKDLQLPLEDLRFSEQRSHQDSCPTTLVLNISEETPMMNLSPATSERPVHIGPILPDAEHKAARQDEQSELWPAIVLYAIIKEVPLRRWKEFLRLLSVADQQLERVELEAGLGSMERQYQMLRLWSQRSSASLSDVFSALHYMDLSGCAQLLQESLERLQWRPEEKQGAMQDT